ncbi:hypothetical protein UlMin_027811 [Ulmus minor]
MNGAWNFVKALEKNQGYPKKILCPCMNCVNLSHQYVNDVYEHLVIKGMDPTYRIWVHHGEQLTAAQLEDDLDLGDTYDLFMAADMDSVSMDIGAGKCSEKEFNRNLEDAATPLYEGCMKYTKLSAIVALYKLKKVNGWSDTSFTGLLELLHDILPEKNVLLKSMYLVRRFLRRFDLKYEKIDACLNDCCLFWGENADIDTCPKCNASRWKEDKHTKEIKVGESAKILRYFPIIPRLKRMFRSEEIAESLRWHSNNKSIDGKMRHPVDSPAWEAINAKWPEFSLEPRNLRLGLAADGINPYKNLSSTYSCWPVMLVLYNLSPLLCMKDDFTLLTLLIPGPRQPGNDIDIYLQPLIEELKELWNSGVVAYDAVDKSFFNLKAMLLWTINNFPAYGNLAGCTTKGKTGCPICGEDTCATWLYNSNKFSYQQTRRFLPHDHPYRSKKS